jgi:hypothetical protein
MENRGVERQVRALRLDDDRERTARLRRGIRVDTTSMLTSAVPKLAPSFTDLHTIVIEDAKTELYWSYSRTSGTDRGL